MGLTKRLHTITKAVVVLTVTAASIQAATIYDFVGTGLPLGSVEFQLTVPDFVLPPVDSPGSFAFFACDQFASSTNCDPEGVTTFSDQSVLGAFSAQLTFDGSDLALYAFFFPTGAFAAPGVYYSGPGGFSGTLTVIDPSAISTDTPEPNSTLFVLNGVWFYSLLFRFRTRR